MLIIIIIIANTNNIPVSNTFPLQRDLSMSFGLTSCPTLSVSFAKQLFNGHFCPPPQKVSFIRSVNSHVCKPFWGPLGRCPWLLGHCQIMLQKLFFTSRKCSEYKTQPFFLVFSSEAFFFPFYCWSFICNSFAICFHMVVNVLKKILVCVGECE